MFKAWRFLGDQVVYVCEIDTNRNRKGDKYAYTSKLGDALSMTKEQYIAFHHYMLDCGTKGYYC